jgi:hypothetical protein
MRMEVQKISEWQPFDCLWILDELEAAVNLDPFLMEEEEALTELKALLRRSNYALVRANPQQPKHVTYFFSDPQRPLPRSGKSLSVYGRESDFLFDYLIDGSLGCVEVRRHDMRQVG